MSREQMQARRTAIPPNALGCVDVAVVGGGPAGSICALLLARGGARVALVDRGGRRPGAIELLSGRARRLLEYHTSGHLAQSMHGVEVFETVSLWGTPTPVGSSMIYNPWGAGVAIDRLVFDEAVRELASTYGTRILAETRVRSVERSQGMWRIVLYHERNASVLYANLLAIATGRAGACFLDQCSVADPPQIALMGRTTIEPLEAGHTLYVEAATNGWWYALPDPRGGRFVGFCTGRDEVKQRGEPLQAFWNRQLRHTRLFAPLLSNAVVTGAITGRPSGKRSFEKVVGESWIAVGDAAFAPDPLSGEGIEFGVESATLGARSLLAGAQRGSLMEYENWVHEYATRHEQLRAFLLHARVVAEA